jgi:antitoxin ParD1/3/4
MARNLQTVGRPTDSSHAGFRLKSCTCLYNSASEVVREALRLMDEKDRVSAAKLEQLKTEVRRGLDSGKSQPWDASKVKQQARVRRSSKTAKA